MYGHIQRQYLALVGGRWENVKLIVISISRRLLLDIINVGSQPLFSEPPSRSSLGRLL